MYSLYSFTVRGLLVNRLYFLVHTRGDIHHCYYSSDTIKGAFKALNSVHSLDTSLIEPTFLGNFDSYDDVIATAPELLI